MCDHVTLSNLHAVASRPDGDDHRRIDSLIERMKALETSSLQRSAAQARILRGKGWTVAEVADFLDVSKYRVRKWTE